MEKRFFLENDLRINRIILYVLVILLTKAVADGKTEKNQRDWFSNLNIGSEVTCKQSKACADK